MKHSLLILLAVLISAGSGQAQTTETAIPRTDSIPKSGVTDSIAAVPEVDSFVWEYRHRRNAKRAGLYAALLPGAGQIYNRQYWKLPIVYAALGTGTGFIIFNLNEYNKTRKEIAARLTLNAPRNPDYEFLNDNQLSQQQDYYRQNLDISVLLTGVGYILQIIDAIAFNHLKDFDITPDISVRFKASALPNNQLGVGLALNFK